MLSRRNFIQAAPAIVATPLLLQACTSNANHESYEAAVSRIWHSPTAPSSSRAVLRRELVRYASLAPSSHNTQCWKFGIEEEALSIMPDLARRCPAVDPDDHHLFVSLGCATENLVQAALANGLQGDARFEAAGEGTIKVTLEPTKPIATALFQAMTERQCTRTPFDGKLLSAADLRLLEQAGTGAGVRVMLLTEKAAMEKILEYVVQGNTAQINDPKFVSELKQWIRFSGDEAVRTGDGLYAATSGNKTVPRWLGSPLFNFFFTPKNENDKYATQVRSSSGIAIFISDLNDKAHWVEVGRCYERFSLQSTALDIRNAFLNQPVEVSALRPQFAAHLGITNGRPDLVVRFGRGPKMPQSLRRPVEAVLATNSLA